MAEFNRRFRVAPAQKGTALCGSNGGLSDGTTVGENGYVVLSIDGPELNLEYRDLADTVLLTERFSPASGGKLTCDLLNVSPILRKVTA